MNERQTLVGTHLQDEPAGGAPRDLNDLWHILWRGRWIIIVSVMVLMAASVTYSLLAQPMYRAEVVLSPVSESPMRPSLGALGGLASLAGINIAAGDQSMEAIATLKSRGFARDFIATQKIMDKLLAERGNSWFGSATKPDIRLAVEMFDRGVRRVTEDRKTGMVTLSIHWKDGAEAATWANTAVSLLNDRMRRRALVESERNVAYLQKEMGATNVVSLQQSIGRLLEAEMQKLMLAKGNDEYAFKVIDMAVAPRRASWPRPALLAALAMLVGGIFSGAFVLLRGHR